VSNQADSQGDRPNGATYQDFKQGVTERNRQAHSDGKQRRKAFDDMRAKLRREADAEMDRPGK
jgi:hypothetical protein